MTEHFTRGTESVTRYCPVCRRDTQHAVSDGRVKHCLEHQSRHLTKRQERQREIREREAQNPRLPLRFDIDVE